jgi:hypothetical protein
LPVCAGFASMADMVWFEKSRVAQIVDSNSVSSSLNQVRLEAISNMQLQTLSHE